jgi:hypothetical protein
MWESLDLMKSHCYIVKKLNRWRRIYLLALRKTVIKSVLEMLEEKSVRFRQDAYL